MRAPQKQPRRALSSRAGRCKQRVACTQRPREEERRRAAECTRTALRFPARARALRCRSRCRCRHAGQTALDSGFPVGIPASGPLCASKCSRLMTHTSLPLRPPPSPSPSSSLLPPLRPPRPPRPSHPPSPPSCALLLFSVSVSAHVTGLMMRRSEHVARSSGPGLAGSDPKPAPAHATCIRLDHATGAVQTQLRGANVDRTRRYLEPQACKTN